MSQFTVKVSEASWVTTIYIVEADNEDNARRMVTGNFSGVGRIIDSSPPEIGENVGYGDMEVEVEKMQ